MRVFFAKYSLTYLTPSQDKFKISNNARTKRTRFSLRDVLGHEHETIAGRKPSLIHHAAQPSS